MKSNELIRQIQAADPSGELECCVGNVDIHFVAREPAYYDGCLQVLVRDPQKEPYYDIVGAKRIGSGDKVVIHELSISDAIFHNPDLPVSYEVGDDSAARYKAADDHDRREACDIERRCDLGFFVRYCGERAGIERPSGSRDGDYEKAIPDELRRAATRFFDRHIGIGAPLPADLNMWRTDSEGRRWLPSWNERRHVQYDREIEIESAGDSWRISKRDPKESES